MKNNLRERCLKDESGIAMALAVIMVLLIGVMGAGLLTFVSTDLNSVVESNQGQRAFEMADAGVKAAKHQLSASQTSGKYNGDPGGGDPPDNQWSLCYQKTPAACAATPAPGVTLVNLDGDGDDSDQFTVTIREIAANTFRVVSTGQYGNAKRKIEAVFSAQDLSIPIAYYTSNTRNDSIDIRSTAVIEDMSLFTQGSITMQSGAQFVGEDLLYGDWENDFNATGRKDASGNPITTPGIGSVCYIVLTSRHNCDGTGPALQGTAAQLNLGTTSYDITGSGGSTNRYAGPRFVNSVSNPQSTSEITFPFDPSTMDYEADAEGLDQRMAYLKELAIEQGNFLCEDASDPECVDKPTILNNDDIVGWPANSTYDTVVYVKQSHDGGGLPTMEWRVPGSCVASDAKKGILIVDGYFLKVLGSTAPFSGVTLAHGGRIDNDQDTFESVSGSCWEGPVSSRGETTIGGRAGFFLTGLNPSGVSDLGGAELQSWREVYN